MSTATYRPQVVSGRGGTLSAALEQKLSPPEAADQEERREEDRQFHAAALPGGRLSPRPGACGEQTRRGRDLSAVAAERGEAGDQDVGEQAGMAAVRVEVGVEDGHLCAGRARGEGGKQSGQLG